MKAVAVWCLLSISWAGAAVAVSSVDNIIPNRFIIEVDNEADIPHKRSFTRGLDAVFSSIRARAVTFEVLQEFDNPGLFVGASVTLETSDDVVAVESLPGIKAIYPVRMFERPKPVSQDVVKGADDPAVPPIGKATHILTGVDKLHEKGIFGKGIKVGILDTGVDYTHPNLGGGIGPAKKVIGGYDFVGDDYTGGNYPYPDEDPISQCDGHGTHVAGIVGASSNNEFDLTGVAPEASLLAYRIFGCTGFTADDVIIAALFRGVQDGADILTLSLGGAHGWTNSAAANIASRIAESGKVVTIAAGNDGPHGSWFAASPSTSINAISVGSLENTVIPLQKAKLTGAIQDGVIYFSLSPLPIKGEWPIYILSDDITNPADGCEPLPEDTPDLSKYVTIVRRGTCTFVTKLANIAEKGGNNTLIYDNGNGFTAVALGNYTAALIPREDGESIVQQYFAGANINVSFPQQGGTVSYPSPTGGLMSNFSSYGPTNDFYFKPAVTAPGGNILSTFPVPLGNFSVASGTSMATPFVAGAAALLLQVKGNSVSVSRAARDIFETTARTVYASHQDGALPQTASVAGAGLINVYDAIFSNTTVSPGELILNDTAHFKGTHKISITNTGSSHRRYKLSHSPAGTALTVRENSTLVALGPVPLSDSAASVIIHPSDLILAPGQRKDVLVNIRLPSEMDKSRFPLYSGYIHLDSPGESLRVTYIGLAASLKDKQILDTSEKWINATLPAILNGTDGAQTVPTNYTFLENDFPKVAWRLAFGTPRLQIDLVNPNVTLRTTLGPRAIPSDGEGPTFSFPERVRPGSFSAVPTIGPIAQYDYLGRHNENEDGSYSTFWMARPTFANGTVIPEGFYRVLLRALRVTGNPERQEDYESWVSPVIGIQYWSP